MSDYKGVGLQRFHCVCDHDVSSLLPCCDSLTQCCSGVLYKALIVQMSFPNMQICQVYSLTSILTEWGIGSLKTVTYEIKNFTSPSKPFSMTATYTAGTAIRIAYVKFIYNETAEVPQFVLEKNSPTYEFVSCQEVVCSWIVKPLTYIRQVKLLS